MGSVIAYRSPLIDLMRCDCRPKSASHSPRKNSDQVLNRVFTGLHTLKKSSSNSANTHAEPFVLTTTNTIGFAPSPPPLVRGKQSSHHHSFTGSYSARLDEVSDWSGPSAWHSFPFHFHPPHSIDALIVRSRGATEYSSASLLW